MQRQSVLSFSRWWLVGALALLMVGGYRVAVLAQSGSDTVAVPRLIARGAGTTIIEGGTGYPRYMPVTTKVAYHVELVNGQVSGGFECLALVPETPAGPGSGEFSQNVMYVTGQVQSVDIQGDSITMRGTSECTGLGAGSNVPFSCTIRKGGPGSTVLLKTQGNPPLTFKEILLDGSFDIKVPGTSLDF
jgi:hypothetical protein